MNRLLEMFIKTSDIANLVMKMGKKSNISPSKKKEDVRFRVWSDGVFPYDVLVRRRPT